MAKMRTNDRHRPIPLQQRRASGPVSLPSSSSSSPSSPTLPLPITRSGTGAGPNHNLSHQGTATAEAFHATADKQEAYELSLFSSSPTFYALKVAQADGHTATADNMSVPLGHGDVDAAAVTAAHEAGEAYGAAKMIRSASSNTHAPRDASVLSSTRPQSVRSASSADDVPLTSGGGGGGTSTTSPLSTPGEGHALHTTQPLSNVDPYVALRQQAMPHPPRTPPSRQQTSSNQTDATYVPLAMTSPVSLASSMSRSPVASMHLPLDSSPYDAFRSTPPDAYPPAIYGMIGPWLASSSTPQSPTFAPMHSHMSSTDSSVYMPGYNAMFLNMGGMMPRPPPGPGLVSNGHGPPTLPMPQPHALQPQSSPSQHDQHQPQQHQPPHFTSPAQHHDYTAQNGLMGMSEARHGRRGSHLSQGALPLSGPPQYGHNPWGGLSHSIVQSGYMPGMPMQAGGWSPIDALNGGAGMHRRIVSGPYSSPVLPPMAYAHQQPGSPNSFGRNASGGGSPGGSNGFGRGMHSRTPSSLSFVSSSYGRMTTPSEQSSRSALLEEFRARHNRGRRFELNDIRGSIVEFSGDQHGSRFTQEKLGTATEAERAMVLDEVLPHALSLTTDVFGNYVVQKLLEHGTDEMRRQLVQQMIGHVLPLSLSTYGCRVVQRALDVIDQASRLQMADELREQVLQCVRDQNANHVVQKVLERVVPTSKVDYIPQTFRGNVFNLAAHCYSCRVLQRIFEHCDDDQTRPLMDELLANTERLMHDQYGNYVVQWVLRNAEQADKDSVIALAKGNVLRLSCHKFASNVVEQIIAAASADVVDELIEEIVSTPTSGGDAKDGVADEANVTATVMMRDQYGNYVLQRFLERADARQKQRLVAVIRPMLHSVKRSAVGYTKHLAAIERLLDSSNVVQRNNAVTVTGRGGGAKN